MHISPGSHECGRRIRSGHKPCPGFLLRCIQRVQIYDNVLRKKPKKAEGFSGFLVAMLYFLRTDGRLLALCDHGNSPCLLDQYGQRSTGWRDRDGFLM